ncbi:MAG: YqgE/AlgH family protein [Planctomycetes bacterium]|nr:YqgE/AlgH family protein [Planctomycetota bacterium]MBT4029556.1 YqgE/AlgH family protein [Planctomycetota bacterium]MBT4560574.1 YqgE/AlgH family protein [Planctomycetota bacterium]MBT5100824.1 YqgE/AlgH family protein [Planctomycetota bacterium]MBT5120760.1 YqgE/AlgH family protein [Planctomycetota bacterium]
MSEQPQAGAVLLARPELLDPNFDTTVVLLCQHDASGSFGVILNRPIQNLSPAKMLPEADWAKEVPQSVFWGGPVQETRMHALHAAPPTGNDALLVLPEMSFGGDLPALARFHADGHAIRLFMGYSGWDSGQLQSEIDLGVWATTATTARFIWDTPPDQLWRRLIGQADPQYQWLDADPECN